MVEVAHARGDTVERAYKVTDFDMDTTTLAGLTIFITVKEQIDDDRQDMSAVLKHELQVSPEGEVLVARGMHVGGLDPVTLLHVEGVESGVFTHFVTWEESTELEPREYVYDVQVKTSHDPPHVKTVIEAAPWIVRGDVTRRAEVTP